MADLGFDCFQDTAAFAQFDSELGVYGKVDFMFVHTDDGLAILERAIPVNDDFWGGNNGDTADRLCNFKTHGHCQQPGPKNS